MKVRNNRSRASIVLEFVGVIVILSFLYPLAYYLTEARIGRSPNSAIFNFLFLLLLFLGLTKQLTTKKLVGLNFNDTKSKLTVEQVSLIKGFVSQEYNYTKLDFSISKITLSSYSISLLVNGQMKFKVKQSDFGKKKFQDIEKHLRLIRHQNRS